MDGEKEGGREKGRERGREGEGGRCVFVHVLCTCICTKIYNYRAVNSDNVWITVLISCHSLGNVNCIAHALYIYYFLR